MNQEVIIKALAYIQVVKNTICVCALSQVWLFVTPWTVTHQVPLSMEFSRQEYWSGLPFPFPGDLPDPGIEPVSLSSPALAGRFFTSWATGEALKNTVVSGGKGEGNSHLLHRNQNIRNA